MPLKRCKKEGKTGWRWGDRGACYTGKDAKKKAIKQGIAIEGGPEKFKKVMDAERKKAKGDDEETVFPTDIEIEEAVQELAEEDGSYTDGIIAGVEEAIKKKSN